MASTIGRNIGHLSFANVIQAAGTFAFWFLVIKLAGAGTLGVSSYIASLALIIATIESLDIPLGMKRSIGLAISKGDIAKFRQVLFSSVVVVTFVVSFTILLISVSPLHVLQYLGIIDHFSIIFILLIISTPFQFLFTEALISSFHSRDLVVPMIIGTIIRFPLLFIFIYILNEADMAAVIAYASLFFLTSSWYGISVIRISTRYKVLAAYYNSFISNSKEVLSAGLASWIPHVIYVAGAQLGIVSIVSIEGEAAGGEFYLAWGIFQVIILIVLSISRVMHSSISGMANREQQANFLTYSMNIAFIFTLPVASALFFFSGDFLNLIGNQFSSSSSYVLTIFMAGVPLSIIIEISYYFVYGRNDQRTVLLLGLFGNIPRIILYFLLPPVFGINGTSLAYVTGSIFQLALTLYILRIHKVGLKLKNHVISTIVPLSIGFVLYLSGINFLVSTILIVVLSVTAYIKIGLFTEIELHSLLYAGLPSGKADKIYPKLSRIIRIIH
jgi:O-antigen/teichoic acid export membrane protein